jgi:hypothetical protein
MTALTGYWVDGNGVTHEIPVQVDQNGKLVVAATAISAVMGASGATHAEGFTPDTPAQAGTAKYLREDATWVAPPFLPLANNISNVSGQSDYQLVQARETTAATPGYDIIVQAGGAKLGGTDLVGGNLRLSGGVSTGTGTSGVTLLGAPAGPTGVTDSAAVPMLAVQGALMGFFAVKANTPTHGQAAAPTAVNTDVLSSTDAAAIGNLRTRVAELEAALINLGLMASRPA